MKIKYIENAKKKNAFDDSIIYICFKVTVLKRVVVDLQFVSHNKSLQSC